MGVSRPKNGQATRLKQEKKPEIKTMKKIKFKL